MTKIHIFNLVNLPPLVRLTSLNYLLGLWQGVFKNLCLKIKFGFRAWWISALEGSDNSIKFMERFLLLTFSKSWLNCNAWWSMTLASWEVIDDGFDYQVGGQLKQKFVKLETDTVHESCSQKVTMNMLLTDWFAQKNLRRHSCIYNVHYNWHDSGLFNYWWDNSLPI